MALNKKLMNLVVAAFAATIFLSLTETGRAAEPRRIVVEITNFKFIPERPALTPGDTITWVNKDIVPHTATAKDGSWDSGLIEVGKQWTVTITADMAVAYFCAYHPMMKAALVIGPKPAASKPAPASFASTGSGPVQ
jgi:plastocyanin